MPNAGDRIVPQALMTAAAATGLAEVAMQRAQVATANIRALTEELRRNTTPRSKRLTGALLVPPEWGKAEDEVAKTGKTFTGTHVGGSRRTKRRSKRRKKKSRRNRKSRRR